MLDETTRRGFFKTTAAAGAASGMLVATPELFANEANVYTRLGVRPVINAAGVLTYLGGSLMPPEVVRASTASLSICKRLNSPHLKKSPGMLKLRFRQCGAT